MYLIKNQLRAMEHRGNENDQQNWLYRSSKEKRLNVLIYAI